MVKRRLVAGAVVLMVLACLMKAAPVGAQTSVHVLILPFEVNATENLAYLKDEIPNILKRYLEERGARVEVAQKTDPQQLKGEGLQGYRRLGIENGADYVIWGSLTWIGNSFSLDAKMLQPIGETPPQTLYLEGEGIENLLGRVKDLAQNFSVRMFKLEKVVDVKIEGNQRIEKDAIMRRIQTKPGDILSTQQLNEDLKSVYAMGYFEDIRIETEDVPNGKIVIFRVNEKPTIREIRIKGNHAFESDELKKNLDIRTGSILNIYQVQNSVHRIESMYREKNYHNVNVDYEVEATGNNQAELTFVIDEGDKVRIRKIEFVGNQAYDDEKLRDQMRTKEKGFFSFFTSSGDLDPEVLRQDAANVEAFYQNHGYINAKVGEPQVDIGKKWIDVTIKVDEGNRFKVGRVDVKGDLILDEKDLLDKLKITKEKFYSRETVRRDVLALNDIYADEGYAYADISPRISEDRQNHEVNIDYVIEKGKQVRFERIQITGNVKTRDKVIRRELGVEEAGLYSGSELKKGIRNLRRLDYFEDVQVETVKGGAEDLMVLKIDVKEKPTGAFSFGGGYSTVEDVFVVGTISQRNLFGRGQTLELQAELGGRTTRYNLSFTEPWLFDIPLSAGVILYNWVRDYDTYDRDSIGAGFRLGYPVYEDTRAYFSYSYDLSDIENITVDAAKSIRELEGENITSKVSATLRYDSRDRLFSPTEGATHELTVQYAGLGGDIGFVKYLGETGWYVPLFWDFVGFAHGRIGYAQEASGKTLPDYEKFYLGGIQTLRGFDWRGVHAEDENGDIIGGEKMVQFNFELIFPLVKKAGLDGVIFFDMGDVYGPNENYALGDLRKSAGFGFRWYSPVGPIRIENGYILDPEEGESSGGRWEFTMGAAF